MYNFILIIKKTPEKHNNPPIPPQKKLSITKQNKNSKISTKSVLISKTNTNIALLMINTKIAKCFLSTVSPLCQKCAHW